MSGTTREPLARTNERVSDEASRVGPAGFARLLRAVVLPEQHVTDAQDFRPVKTPSCSSRKALIAVAFALTTALVWPLSAQAPDAAAHKAWMNDASDAQDDYRFAVSEKDQKAAVESLVKLEALMAKTEDYWTAKKMADGVKLAKESRALAAQAQAAAKRGDTAAAGQSFDKMGASCNSCHELHLEKR